MTQTEVIRNGVKPFVRKEMTCSRCGYVWDYRGRPYRGQLIKCPVCGKWNKINRTDVVTYEYVPELGMTAVSKPDGSLILVTPEGVEMEIVKPVNEIEIVDKVKQ